MKRVILSTLLFLGTLAGFLPVNAQLIQKAEDFIRKALSDSETDSTTTEGLSIEELHQRDSIRLSKLAIRLEEMERNELMLRAELDNALNHNHVDDSLKIAEQKLRIDSLRKFTAGVPLVIDEDTLFFVYASRGGFSAADRVEMAREIILKASKDRSLRNDSVYIMENEGFSDLMCGSKVIYSITDLDALWHNTTREGMAIQYAKILSNKISELRKGHSLFDILIRVALFIIVIAAQYLLFRLTNYLFRRLRRIIIRFKQQRLKPIIIKDYELLNKRRLGRMLIFLSNILRYLVYLTLLMFTVPLLFAIFPQTENLALNIFMYIIEPVKMIGKSIVDYFPNLFIIIGIWVCIRYLIKGIKYFADEIENNKLKITGFYPDWAQPTFNIIRFLLYAFMIAMIYPYLPGSDSGVFQGISVFVGLIISLGSSTVIGNIIAGLVITYMRPFKLGDRIKFNDTTGNVIEKTPFVTRLRTPKNEVVTIPNSFIMSSHTINYSASARQFGLILHTTVTIGYDVPWRQIHRLLINAARITPGIEEYPKPFVLETGLSDYYPCYQINAYTKDADNAPKIMSALLQNIQDTFNEAGVEIMSPQYIATRDGNASTIPAEYIDD